MTRCVARCEDTGWEDGPLSWVAELQPGFGQASKVKPGLDTVDLFASQLKEQCLNRLPPLCAIQGTRVEESPTLTPVENRGYLLLVHPELSAVAATVL